LLYLYFIKNKDFLYFFIFIFKIKIFFILYKIKIKIFVTLFFILKKNKNKVTHLTVTALSYLEKLRREIVPSITRKMDSTDIFYMQDGAPPHYAQSVRQFLDETFPNRWIGRRGPIEWPARSPDLTPTDFFLWGVIKDRVYVTEHGNLEELKEAITAEIRSLPVELCQRACQSVSKRLQLCKDLEGKHFEHLL
jgi:hypothetical protein